MVTNYNYVTETTGVTAAIWVQGGVAPHAFVRTALKSIAESPSTDKSGSTLAIAVDRMSVDGITNPGFQCTYPGCTAQPFLTRVSLSWFNTVGASSYSIFDTIVQ